MDDLGGFDSSRVIVIDTETTGLKPGNDEVLSLSIIGGNGNVLFDDLVRPTQRKRWPNATKVNGITWNDVKDKGTLAERAAEILPIFRSAQLVVGYNVEFDLSMLEASGLHVGELRTFDLMKEYARTEPGGRYIKLTECAKRYGYEYTPHESLEDVKATLYCFRRFVSCRDLLSEEKNAKRAATRSFRKIGLVGFMVAAIGAAMVAAGGVLGFLVGIPLVVLGFIVALVGFVA